MRQKPKQSTIDKRQAYAICDSKVQGKVDKADTLVQAGMANPLGTIDSRSLLAFDFTKECKRRSPAALQTLSNIMLSGNPAQRIRCAEVILAYAYGKPIDTNMSVSATAKPADIVKLIEARRKGRASVADKDISSSPMEDSTLDVSDIDTTNNDAMDV